MGENTERECGEETFEGLINSGVTKFYAGKMFPS